MYTLNRDSCEDCTSRRSVRPPCITIRMQPNPGVTLVYEDHIGWTCPFKASWEDIVQYTRLIPHHAGIDKFAEQYLTVIKHKIAEELKAYHRMPQAIDCNILVCGKTNCNNNVTYVLPDGSKRRMTFLRRLSESDWWRFWNEFQGYGFITPVARMTTEEKFGVAVDRGYKKVPAQFQHACAELVNPAAAGLVIGVFVLLALTPAKIVPMVKNAILGLGLTTHSIPMSTTSPSSSATRPWPPATTIWTNPLPRWRICWPASRATPDSRFWSSSWRR